MPPRKAAWQAGRPAPRLTPKTKWIAQAHAIGGQGGVDTQPLPECQGRRYQTETRDVRSCNERAFNTITTVWNWISSSKRRRIDTASVQVHATWPIRVWLESKQSRGRSLMKAKSLPILLKLSACMLVVGLTTPPAIRAQQVTASITGQVTDPSGAPI